MDFKQELNNYQEIINNELEKYLRKQECPEKLLNKSMEYSLMAGGKRLRPILMIDVYKIFSDDYEKCLPFAVAMEMIHNFSLIHDDLPGIDNDDFRHGKQTNHKKFNEATAILAGDGLLNGAYQVIANNILKETDAKNQKTAFYYVKIHTHISYLIQTQLSSHSLPTHTNNTHMMHYTVIVSKDYNLLFVSNSIY